MKPGRREVPGSREPPLGLQLHNFGIDLIVVNANFQGIDVAPIKPRVDWLKKSVDEHEFTLDLKA